LSVIAKFQLFLFDIFILWLYCCLASLYMPFFKTKMALKSILSRFGMEEVTK